MLSYRSVRQRIILFVPMLLGVFLAVSPLETARAEALPEAVKHMLVQSVTEDGGRHLEATVKMAAAAVPDAKKEILFLMVLYAPNKIAAVKAALGLDPETPSVPAVAVAAQEDNEANKADGQQAKPTADEPASADRITEDGPVGFFSTRNLTGKLELGGAVNTGNTDDESLAVSLALSRKDGPWTYDFKSAFDIQRRDNETTQQRLVSDLGLAYDITPRLYAYGAASYEDDEFSGFNYRITSGGGLGYRIYTRPRLNWSVEMGPGVRIDSFEDTGNVNVTPAIRAFSDFAWDFSEFASFLHEVEMIQDGGLTVDTTAALVARITERVSGQLSYQVRFNGDAPVGNEEIDTTTRLSLIYDF